MNTGALYPSRELEDDNKVYLKHIFNMPLVTIKKDISSYQHIAGKITPYKIDFGLYSKIVVRIAGGNGGWITVCYSNDSDFSSFTVIRDVQVTSAQILTFDISEVTGEYYVGLLYNQGGTSTSIAEMSVVNNLNYFEVSHRRNYARVSGCYFEV